MSIAFGFYDITITASAFPTLDDARAERFQQLVLAVLPEETEVELERLATNPRTLRVRRTAGPS